MATITLYMDENIPKSVTNGMRQRGYDVVIPQDAGLLGGTDVQQLAYATQHGRVLVTHDADFLALHRIGVHHIGIVFATHDISIGAFIAGLELIIGALEPHEMVNHVEFL